MSGYVFVVVVNGTPIYEHSVGTVNLPSDGPNSYQFVLHAALDMVEEHLWKTGTMNLKRIDAFQGQNISAYVTASNVVFLLMHERASEDSVGSFMHQVHEMYIKIASFALPDVHEHVNGVQCHGQGVFTREGQIVTEPDFTTNRQRGAWVDDGKRGVIQGRKINDPTFGFLLHVGQF